MPPFHHGANSALDDEAQKEFVIKMQHYRFKLPPQEISVNSCIIKSFYLGLPFNLMLPSVSTLTDRLIKLGPNAWFWGADLAREHTAN